IAQLTQDVDWAETTAKTGDTGQKKRTVDDMTTKEITQQAMVVQDQTKDATERIIRNIQQTEAVGDVALVIAVEVNDELHKQGEQLQNVKEGLVSVESNLKRADKQLRVFMRFDWYISPSDRFAYESKFSKYSDDNDEITLSQLEPLYQPSHLSQAEFAQIWTLISLASPSINQEQFVYFQHVLASRRRGRPLPVGLPLSVKEAFLKAKPESKMYTRYIPGTRDIAASTWKDAAQLQEEQRVVEQDIATHEVAREEAERALSELTITSDEMAGLAGYKRNHLSAVRDDVGMLRESLRLLKAGVGKSSGADTGSGVMQKDVDDLLAKLLEEKRALEARKQALLVRLH
ncbi:endocytosis defective- protein, partial [Entophlyctis luteolus]